MWTRRRPARNWSINDWQYVAISRGRYDAQLYTDNKDQLSNQLARNVSHESALESAPSFSTNPTQKPQRQTLGHGMGR